MHICGSRSLPDTTLQVTPCSLQVTPCSLLHTRTLTLLPLLPITIFWDDSTLPSARHRLPHKEWYLLHPANQWLGAQDPMLSSHPHPYPYAYFRGCSLAVPGCAPAPAPQQQHHQQQCLHLLFLMTEVTRGLLHQARALSLGWWCWLHFIQVIFRLETGHGAAPRVRGIRAWPCTHTQTLIIAATVQTRHGMQGKLSRPQPKSQIGRPGANQGGLLGLGTCWTQIAHQQVWGD